MTIRGIADDLGEEASLMAISAISLVYTVLRLALLVAGTKSVANNIHTPYSWDSA